jgi:hypothetical protein
MNAVPDSLDSRQLLRVEVDHLSGASPLITNHRKGWLQLAEPT